MNSAIFKIMAAAGSRFKPANTSATIYLPADTSSVIEEGNSSAWQRDSISLRFGDGTVTTIDRKSDQLLVKRKGVVIAFNDDRFIPFGSSIYAFSKTGSNREWTLPELFRRKALHVFTLTEQGRGAAPAYQITGNKIRLKLTADVPVKIEIR